MIAFLQAEHGLDNVAAYMLCSVAGDLRMHEVVRLIILVIYLASVLNCRQIPYQVDMPNYVVSTYLLSCRRQTEYCNRLG